MTKKVDMKKSAEHMIGQAKTTAEIAKGKMKEAAGSATGNHKLEVRGKLEQAKGRVQQAGKKARDAFDK
jgi:uncharacterized protein YjbJ (UPF0337 family)